MLNPEHVLVPYQDAELPAGPWLVFAPHADDETFGMGGSLLRAKDAGIATHVIVLTDGALGGDTADLVAVRRGELNRAASMLGLQSVECWTEPDRSVAVTERLLQRVVESLQRMKPASVFFPAPLELHPDHRATAQLVWTALQHLAEAGSNYTPWAYAYEISVQSPINMLVDISAYVAAKQQVMAAYASQNGQNDYQNLVLALNIARTFTLPAHVTHAEGFCNYPTEYLSLSLQRATQMRLALYW